MLHSSPDIPTTATAVSVSVSTVNQGTTERISRSGKTIVIDHARDSLLPDFARATLGDRYLLSDETYQALFARVACTGADDEAHAQRLYDYISRLWFMPATPVLTNLGSTRGLPISCFLNHVEDSMKGIADTQYESIFLAAAGGGIGTCWDDVREINAQIGENGKTSGVISFISGLQDGMTRCVSQGNIRRGSAAAYLRVDHPEILEFLEIRNPSGDFNRKALNLHHGIMLSDVFMQAVRDNSPFELRSRKDGMVVETINARQLWTKILELRMKTGEPYLVFEDTVNRSLAKHQQLLGLKVSTSNLCSEIMLHTGRDHLGRNRTAVCCLSSLNVELFDEWADDDMFIVDVMRFLDNVLQIFIDTAPDTHANAVYSAKRERSVGLGIMGFHSMLQSKGIPLESAMAKSWNLKIMKRVRAEADRASFLLAEERGPCPDAAEVGMMERFSHKLAVAPTASISIICGATSACFETIPANVYSHKTLSGTFSVRNRHLAALLAEKGQDTDAVWASIIEAEGSVQHLDFLDEDEKDTFKTAFEIDQRWIIELAADRMPYICQGASLNLYLPADVNKFDLHMLHWTAWERGIKSLYYLRTKSILRSSFIAGGVEADNTRDHRAIIVGDASEAGKYDECLACQ